MSSNQPSIQKVSQFEYPNVMNAVDDRMHVADSQIWGVKDEPALRPASDTAGIREAQLREIGRVEGEACAKAKYEALARQDFGRTTETLRSFEAERGRYFETIESEVVQLALAIARRVLHREAQVDPGLLAGLVRYTLEKLRDGTTVKLSVNPVDAAQFEGKFGSSVQILSSPQMLPGMCTLETEVGTTAISVDAQLKEVEHGLLDLLAQRPAGVR